MLAIIRALVILIVAFFTLIMLKEKTISLPVMVVGLGIFVIFIFAFAIYHPIVGVISMVSLVLIGLLFVLDTKMEIEKYKLRRMLYSLIGIFSISFTMELIETVFGRLF